MPKKTLTFETCHRVAESLRLRLSETGRSKGGTLNGTCFVLVDEDRDGMAVCDTLSDLAQELQWRIVHILTDHGPERFILALENGVMTIDEFFGVAGELPPKLAEPFVRRRLEVSTPKASQQRAATKRL